MQSSLESLLRARAQSSPSGRREHVACGYDGPGGLAFVFDECPVATPQGPVDNPAGYPHIARARRPGGVWDGVGEEEEEGAHHLTKSRNPVLLTAFPLGRGESVAEENFGCY